MTTTSPLEADVAMAVTFRQAGPIDARIKAAGVAESPDRLDGLRRELEHVRGRASDLAGPTIDRYVSMIDEVKEWRGRCSSAGWPITTAPVFRPVVERSFDEASRWLVAMVLHAHSTTSWPTAVKQFEDDMMFCARSGRAPHRLLGVTRLGIELGELSIVRLLSTDVQTAQFTNHGALAATAKIRLAALDAIDALELRKR